jgi:hypothetical protein
MVIDGHLPGHQVMIVVIGETVETYLDRLVAPLDRGECVYLVVYSGGRPSELCFAGYTYD